MKIVRFNTEGHCQFIHFNWRKFRFEESCRAKTITDLFGRTKGKKHFIIGLWNM